jgi:glycosyltransferase involved in cell wall biosynthesis
VLTVIIPAHNPDLGRLARTLSGLSAQTLPISQWETVLVDNASAHFPDAAFVERFAPRNLSIVKEPELGLSAARRRGFALARGDLAVLVDDDNVLAPDYLANVLAIFAAKPRLGIAGGKSLPEFASEPPTWVREFFPLLALRDLGENEMISQGLRSPGATRNEYPLFAPIGAGMALRRAAWSTWSESSRANGELSDRRGSELTSSGDNHIVLCALAAGWEVGYFPGLSLTHLIPASRLEAGYLARLNRGIQKSWMQVLTRHDANPWPLLTRTSAALRKFKAWFTYRGWSSPAAQIRWQGACGHFEGRIASPSVNR